MKAPTRNATEILPAVTAHAGSLHTVANTPESFQAALAFPVDYLEADVRFTPDHVAYLSHDALPQPLQRKPMSLEDLLKQVSPHPSVRLNLDMKEYSGVQEMAGLITRSGMASRVLLTGVTRDAASKVRSGAEGLPYLLNANPSPRQCLTASGAAALARTIRACGALGLNVHHRFLTRRLARSLSADGLSVSVWTVDSARGMRRMLRLPVDNVTTRRVDQMLALRGGMVP